MSRPAPVSPSWSGLLRQWPSSPRLLVPVALGLLLGCAATLPARAQALATTAATADWRSSHASARIDPNFDATRHAALSQTRHPVAALAQDLGELDGSTHMDHLILVLQASPEQQSALSALHQAQLDPQSADFHHWLTPQAFGDHFGVHAKDIALLSQWLTQAGLHVDELPAGGQSIVFSGSAAQVSAAFGTRLHRVQWQGESHVVNLDDLTLPQAFATVVSGVVGLSDFQSHAMHALHTSATTGALPLASGLGAPAPASTPGAGSAQAVYGSTDYLAPSDFATIYDLKPLYASGIDGSSQAIAVLGRSNVVLSDIASFRSTMGLSANAPSVVTGGTMPGYVSGDQGESDLDLEWAGAVAPAANIIFVTTASTTSSDGVTLSAQYAVANNVAPIISLSYGLCERLMGSSGVSFFSSLWQQAVTQGMTVLVAAGDSGAAGCASASASSGAGEKGVNGMCTSPYSTCVGGTEFNVGSNASAYWASSDGANLQSALSYIPEQVWNQGSIDGGSGLWASGGGASTYISKPSWQSLSGVPADGKRDVPDVALNASSANGYLIISSDNTSLSSTTYVAGGTSAATPAFAALVALASQQSGYRLGNINPTLYGLAGLQLAGGRAYFHQITSGSNAVTGLSGYAASTSTPGYSQAAGLGSVDANVLVTHWSDLLATTSVSLGASSSTVLSGNALTLTATVTGSSLSGSVKFLDGSTTLASGVSLSGGVATWSGTNLSLGSHALTAVYSGDPSHQASTSASVNVSVLDATTTSLSVSSTTPTAGQAITLSASVSGNSPTGSVQFFDGATALSSAIALSNASATLVTTLNTATTHKLSAVYSGDADNVTSSSPVQAVVVAQASTTTTLGTSASPILDTQALTLSASVNGDAPSGSVSFYDGSTLLGSASLSGTTASLVVSGLSDGSHSLSATYSGDSNNLTSTSAKVVEVVQPAANLSDAPLMPGWLTVLTAGLLLASAARANTGRNTRHITRHNTRSHTQRSTRG